MKKINHVVGIDLAKESFYYQLEDAEGRRLEAGSWKNSQAEVGRLLKHLQERLGDDLSGMHVGMEATGRYGRHLFALLCQAGVRVSVINPAQIKHFAASLNRRGKNDPMDAATIARFVRERRPATTRPLSAKQQRLKEMVGEIDHLVAEGVRVQARLKEIAPSCPEVARSLRAQKRFLDTQIASLETKIARLLEGDAKMAAQVALLKTIPGIAFRTSVRLLAQLAGKEFSNARQLAAYAGVSPHENTSGTSLRGKTRMSKKGNAILRRALYMPAMAFWRQCDEIKAWADAIASRTASRKAALGAVMRKLIHVIFGVLKHQRPFDPERVSSPVSAI